MFHILLSYQGFEMWCAFYTSGTTRFRLAIVEVFSSLMWPAVTTCNMTDLEGCKNRVMRKCWGRELWIGWTVKSSVLGIMERGEQWALNVREKENSASGGMCRDDRVCEGVRELWERSKLTRRCGANTHHTDGGRRGCCVLGNDEKRCLSGEMQEKILNGEVSWAVTHSGRKGLVAWKQMFKKRGMIDSSVCSCWVIKMSWRVGMEDNARWVWCRNESVCSWDGTKKRIWWDRPERRRRSEHHFKNRKKICQFRNREGRWSWKSCQRTRATS